MICIRKSEKQLKRDNHENLRMKRNRVGIPADPCEYEQRRILAQQVVDSYHGPRRYRVVGKPGEMLRLVAWVDYPLLPTTRSEDHALKHDGASSSSSAAA